MVSMNRLDLKARAKILGMMVERQFHPRHLRRLKRQQRPSHRFKLLIDVGTACSRYQDETLVNLPCKRLQLDEIWSFVGMKDKNVPAELKGVPGIGDTWTWTAIDADTKLIASWMCADLALPRTAHIFVSDLARSASKNRVQITTDGRKAYIDAVAVTFNEDVDYAMLIKLYGASPEGEKRYSAAECIGIKKKPILGDPDYKHISTSYAERQKPDYAHEHAPLHTPNERIFQKGRKPHSRTFHLFYALQFRTHPSDATSNPSDGSRSEQSCLVFGRNCGACGVENLCLSLLDKIPLTTDLQALLMILGPRGLQPH